MCAFLCKGNHLGFSFTLRQRKECALKGYIFRLNSFSERVYCAGRLTEGYIRYIPCKTARKSVDTVDSRYLEFQGTL